MEKTKVDYGYLFSLIAIGIILFVSAYFRLDNIRGYMVFLGDQGRDVLTVMHMVKKGDMVFIGPTASVGGFFLGPFYYYLMVPALIASNFDPVGPAVMVALFSVITTYLVYYFGRNYFNPTTGLVAGAIFAVSRLVVEYSRFSWNPNVLPFFSMVLLIALAKILDAESKQKKLWFLTIGACMGIIVQLHYQAVVMNILALVVYIFYVWREYEHHITRKLRSIAKEIGLMCAGFGIFIGPFLLFEIYHKFPNSQNIFRFVFGNRGEGFSGGQSYEFIVRDTIYRLFLRLVGAGNDTVAQIAIVIVIAGLLLALYNLATRFYDYIITEKKPESFNKDFSHYVRNRSKKGKFIGYIIVIGYFIIGVAFWGFYKKSIYDYYYSYMYPLPILLVASSIGLIIHYQSRRLQAKTQRSIQLVLTGSFFIFVVGVLWLNIQSVRSMMPGMQVWRTEEVADAIIRHKTEGKYNFALITPGNSDHAYRYFLEIKNEAPTPLEVQVTTQLMVFCEVNAPKPCEPQGNSLWEVAGFGQASIVGQWQVIGLPLFRLEHIESTKDMEGKPAQKG